MSAKLARPKPNTGINSSTLPSGPERNEMKGSITRGAPESAKQKRNEPLQTQLQMPRDRERTHARKHKLMLKRPVTATAAECHNVCTNDGDAPQPPPPRVKVRNGRLPLAHDLLPSTLAGGIN